MAGLTWAVQEKSAEDCFQQTLARAQDLEEKLQEKEKGNSLELQIVKAVLPAAGCVVLLSYARLIVAVAQNNMDESANTFFTVVAIASIISLFAFFALCIVKDLVNMKFYSRTKECHELTRSVAAQMTSALSGVSDAHQKYQQAEQQGWKRAVQAAESPDEKLERVNAVFAQLALNERTWMNRLQKVLFIASTYMVAGWEAIVFFPLIAQVIARYAFGYESIVSALIVLLGALGGSTLAIYYFLYCRKWAPSMASAWLIPVSGLAGFLAIGLIIAILAAAGYLIFQILKVVIVVLGIGLLILIGVFFSSAG